MELSTLLKKRVRERKKERLFSEITRRLVQMFYFTQETSRDTYIGSREIPSGVNRRGRRAVDVVFRSRKYRQRESMNARSTDTRSIRRRRGSGNPLIPKERRFLRDTLSSYDDETIFGATYAPLSLWPCRSYGSEISRASPHWTRPRNEKYVGRNLRRNLMRVSEFNCAANATDAKKVMWKLMCFCRPTFARRAESISPNLNVMYRETFCINSARKNRIIRH